MIPGVVIAVGFILAYGGPPFLLGGTLTILFIAYLVLAMPEATLTSEAAVGQVGNELSEASHVSGASQARTFVSVYIPLMLPGLAAGWALVFVRVIGDLEASVMLATTGNPVIGYEIYGIFNGGGGFDTLAALAVLVTVISTAVLVLVLGLSGRRAWRKA
jgi:iron(III) transport system permease protein